MLFNACHKGNSYTVDRHNGINAAGLIYDRKGGTHKNNAKTFLMLQIENHLSPSTLEEAYETLTSVPGSLVLGGCGYIRLGDRTISNAIDLSNLGLNFVHGTKSEVEIGAMTTLRTIETDALCQSLWHGLLPRSVENIVGVQLRNCVTIGGTVAGRYPFSDPLTALLALDARLQFYHYGEISLEEFFTGQGLKDILVKIIIPKRGQIGAFQSVRRAKTDYAVLNAAVTKTGDDYRIVVGARPGRAVLVPEASDYLSSNGLNETTARKAGNIAAASLQFGDNPRGSGEYRKAICPVLIARALMEVHHAA
ncbi:CO or xanthine dehydrogenase, FAD-binding subunit [Desulfopila aestuarii DSM 18488]|uniref:CO or xanthine dehydrogenase, FAD-binding subunit n=2 Tax=Desulfopila aestuarii TaxID=231440 RepID=A0A1M7Y8X1_9BACT|nr:CO or xanthine dehydrogenase, FAD-binding subunit [Desulfopila aestuarii DSM 18488]